MEKRQVRLTTMLKSCFSFGELLREGDQRLKSVPLIDKSDMEVDENGNPKNPDNLKGFEVGYATIPKGFFRVEEVGDGSDIQAAEPSKVQTEGQNISHLITKALGQLDPEHEGHWNSEGLPRMDAVCGFVGQKVTRAEVEFAEPGFNRESNRDR